MARAARYGISMTGTLVLPGVMVGIAEASTTQRPAMRNTRQYVSSSGDDVGSHCVPMAPITQVLYSIAVQAVPCQ
ncbi:hypothetical protein BOO86_00845 [Mycobacterium sp. CBMA 234]|nr:hypothetical protein [Mycolicibacterium sp. CBMA 234]